MKSKKKNRSGGISIFSSRKKTQTHLYTKGGEFSLDGVDYIGEFHIEGSFAFTGPTPIDIGTNINKVGDPDLVKSKIKLSAAETNSSGKMLGRVYLEQYQYDYEKIKNFDISIRNFADPIPYLYKPKDAAFEAGEDERYFVQKRGDDDSYVVEIDSGQWERLGQYGGIDDGLYAHTSVIWKLVGSFDLIAQQNELALFKAQKIIPSILFSIKSFTEEAQFTRF